MGNACNRQCVHTLDSNTGLDSPANSNLFSTCLLDSVVSYEDDWVCICNWILCTIKDWQCKWLSVNSHPGFEHRTWLTCKFNSFIHMLDPIVSFEDDWVCIVRFLSTQWTMHVHTHKLTINTCTIHRMPVVLCPFHSHWWMCLQWWRKKLK